MWNISHLAYFFDPTNTARPEVFEQEYTCYPVSFLGREDLENGNKILLPQSALSSLARMNVSWPMLFNISNVALTRETHGGVLEFSATEGTCYLPYWMMKNLLLKEGDLIKVRNTTLPKGEYVKLQSVTKDFLEISDHRAVLEYTLRRFAALTVGDNIVIHHNNRTYEIEIIETLPASAISIIETDVQVDFAPPKDYVEPEYQPPTKMTNSKTTPPLNTNASSRFDSPESEAVVTNNITNQHLVRLPGGVRTYCAEYTELLKSGKLPGKIGKAHKSTNFPEQHSSQPFILFGGTGNLLN